MTTDQLIGDVAGLYLRERLDARDEEGTARFIIDCLSADQTVAIASAIQRDSWLLSNFEIKLPAHFVGEYDLPSSFLTEERATYFRNADCARPALLLANTGDDEEQSLKDLVPLGAPQLMEQTALWVKIASEGLELIPEHQRWWDKALNGLQDLHFAALDRLAEYILRTRSEILDEGRPLIDALGAALPSLHLPKDTTYFRAIHEKTRTHTSKWKAQYATAHKKRAPFLSKQNPSGLLLSESELKKSFERVQDSVPEQFHPVVQQFISTPSGWNESSAALAACEWELIKPLFDGLRRQQYNFAVETREFYDQRAPDLLSDWDQSYLEQLLDRKKTTEALDDDELFYERHRNELREDRKLKSAWDRFVFGAPKESTDFLIGMVTSLEALFGQTAPSTSRKLTIRCDSRSKKDFRELNVDAGLYFERRYKGLKELFGNHVTWEVGELFDFSKLVEEWKKKKTKQNHSTAKAALQLKFVLDLQVELLSGGTERYTAQMVWKYDPRWVASEFAADWERLANHPLMYVTASRAVATNQGARRTVNLRDAKSFVPANRAAGSFVGAYKADRDIEKVWRRNLQQAQMDGLLLPEHAQRLSAALDRFVGLYGAALSGLIEAGLHHPALEAQARAYGDLLQLLCEEAPGDQLRAQLLRPLLAIGTVNLAPLPVAAVITPWHPLRLAAMTRKARKVAELTQYLLGTAEIDFGDPRIFFNDLKEELEHPFYPEVVLGWYGQQPQLLSLTDVAGDYTLHESPIATNRGPDDTNENPFEGSRQVLSMVERYVALHPHEQANLSVVLYNSDSAHLPRAVVDRMAALHADEEDVRCQIVLRHRDGSRLRQLYENIVDTAEGDADQFNASEATRDFMARLRIGIMADEAPAPRPEEGPPHDIVFSQDVIARNAGLEWYEHDATPLDPHQLSPGAWSRRRPAAKDDLKSVVFLTSPANTAEGWAYLTAITTFFKGDWNGKRAQRILPARQLNFEDPATVQVFTETHNLASWVVNFDDLLDRRQLANQGVRVIRYKQSSTQGRNLVVSSSAPLGLLKSMVVSRLADLNLDLTPEQYGALAERFIEEANEISGDIVLRAAKRGRAASELIGIVLSRYLVRHELGTDRNYGWYFLDDYASWLGQKEEQIADLLVLSPEQTSDGGLRLAVVVTEAKYIDAASLAAKRKESQKQLRDTLKRIRDAIFGSPHRLDRDLWLARISDLLMDGVQFPASAVLDLHQWRRAIRDGTCELYLRGYSHVFISGPSDAPDSSEMSDVAELEDAYQEVFGRPKVRDLVLQMMQNKDPAPVRSSLSERDVWRVHYYQRPGGSLRTAITCAPEVGSEMPDVAATPPESELREGGPSPEKPVGSVQGFEETSERANEQDARWAYPALASLFPQESSLSSQSADDGIWLKEIETRTRGALQQFQLQAKLRSSTLTPNAALLKFAGSADLTVDKVLARRKEFLTTFGLELVAVQPEAGIVALSVARPQRQVVHLQSLWSAWRVANENGNQELLIGVRESDGTLLTLSPGTVHAPHTLIAGSTGSGKSVLMQNIILSIAATNTPAQARIVLIDPKFGVDYFGLESLPHLEGGIIDNHEEALARMTSLVDEMEKRYKRFRDAKAPNLRAYNAKVPPHAGLPVLWLVHDEFAEWMMVEDYKNEVVSLVGRLGVKARAAGIHLIFAAQRPDVNVMPLVLRSQLGNRLILRVDSEGTSEIALGERGAERLLGRGHLAASIEGEAGIIYAQVPFAPPEFVVRMVQAISPG